MSVRAQVKRSLSAIGITPRRRRPFLERSHPYRGHDQMLKLIGPELAAEIRWPAANTPPKGELAKLFNETDDVHKWVHYLPIYESVLSNYRIRPIKMLEIGVDRGGSLRMWRRYLHHSSTIVGIDINPLCQQFDDPGQKINVRIGGQQDTTFLQEVTDEFGPFDVILDDGSHLTSHMIDTFRYLFINGLADGGVYIVEDIHSNYWTEFRDGALSFVDFTKWLLDAMHAHYQATGSELEFRVGDPQRRREIPVPAVTPLLGELQFYDSIAIVHRARRELPRTIRR